MIAQGPLRVLQIHDSRTSVCPQPAAPRALRTVGTEPPPSSAGGGRTQLNPVLTKLVVNMHSVGVSVIDASSQELIYLSMKNILLQSSSAVGSETFRLEVSDSHPEPVTT